MSIPEVTTVPGRSCGECNYCCQYLTIDTPEIQVEPGCLCPNWKTGQGCSIYDTRPPVCRGYLCGWMMFSHFDDSWRPDISGVIVTPMNENIPEGYANEGIEFLIIKPNLTLAKPDFFKFINRAIRARIPIALALGGPPGHKPNRQFLNTALEPAIHNQDDAEFRRQFDIIFSALQAMPFKKAEFLYKKS